MAGAAGAIAAPIIGIVAPNQFGIVPSILMVCWVAVGGRGTLYGGRRSARSSSTGAATPVSEHWPDTGSTCRACCSSSCVAFIPGGIVGLCQADRSTPAQPAQAPTRGRRERRHRSTR